MALEPDYKAMYEKERTKNKYLQEAFNKVSSECNQLEAEVTRLNREEHKISKEEILLEEVAYLRKQNAILLGFEFGKRDKNVSL